MTNAHPITAFVISITPFEENGELDATGLGEHLDRLAAAGLGVYVAGGGSGEAYSMSRAERRRVMELATERLAGRAPVRAMGVEPRTAAEMLEFADDCAAVGVEAMQVYSLDVGHGEYPTEAEIDAYFGEVLGQAPLPCVLSTHRSVNYHVAPSAIASLAKRYDNLIAVNCTRDDFYVDALLSELEGVDVFVGGEMHGLNAFAIGAAGYLSSIGNLVPRTVMGVVDRYNAGDLAGAAELYASVLRLGRLIYTQGGIRITKALLRHFGLPGGYTRAPRLPADPAVVAEIADVIRDRGVDRVEGW